jgi:hypothetical protein
LQPSANRRWAQRAAYTAKGFTVAALVGKVGVGGRAAEELRSKIILLTIRRDRAE